MHLQTQRMRVMSISFENSVHHVPGTYSDEVKRITKNILVFSAGGFGHVPIPLPKPLRQQGASHMPASKRKYMASFVGTLTGAHGTLRQIMYNVFTRWAQQRSNTPSALLTNKSSDVYIGKLSSWTAVMCDSVVQLLPRGFGRSSFHVYETLEMKLLPLYIYWDGDTPWLPYIGTQADVIFSTPLSNATKMVEYFATLSDKDLLQLEMRTVKFYQSHYTYSGIVQQIMRYCRGGVSISDLRCQGVPPSIRGFNDKHQLEAGLALLRGTGLNITGEYQIGR
eukprot:m.1051861 g.1051861  ORF g.1051861 m.1051861 type:complete len:280 (+) comp24180_c2_seq12:394-1233(+)